MSSPVHRILFSPPNSPPSYPVSDDETESLSTLRDLLLPIARSPGAHHANSPKVSSPLANANVISRQESGPGGFASTSGYPSRYSGGSRRPSAQAGPERHHNDSPNPFEINFSLIGMSEPRGDGLHRRSSSNTGGLPVYHNTQTTQRKLWNMDSIPQRPARLVLMMISLIAGLYILTGSSIWQLKGQTDLTETGTLSPAVMREHLIAMQSGSQTSNMRGKSASYAVAGKKVVVRPGGAPSRIYAASRPNVASGKPNGSLHDITVTVVLMTSLSYSPSPNLATGKGDRRHARTRAFGLADVPARGHLAHHLPFGRYVETPGPHGHALV